ncbi:hypothetical protein [Vibrio parahaemolyticus]|uniref:hypothetical protein n=1 Tax=Vibrio parahaemolyticus TaxID=670 RepID=UPI0004D634F5|nr:hypothetical protein [Vibrio parahaemolyticus]ODX21121.1 hypothetical protein BBM91_14340 [Vibrio parahaemolyticus]OQK26197.1 hypothetical protein XM70_c11753 [Vibrio parahaemolyticus]OQU11887.1 hypothetical protein EN01_023355 [Vibrio parahaemolyticus]
MLGTILLLGMIVCGYLNLSFWILVPASIVAAFIGLHFPSGKAEMFKARGMYWSTFFGSIPLQAILLSILFGAGWGLNALIN